MAFRPIRLLCLMVSAQVSPDFSCIPFFIAFRLIILLCVFVPLWFQS